MADQSSKPGNHEKTVIESEHASQASSTHDSKKSTWQMVVQYRTAISWSAFMGLGAINWGLDVLVRVMIYLEYQFLTMCAALQWRGFRPIFPERFRVPLS
jgi:hypothetical protein